MLPNNEKDYDDSKKTITLKAFRYDMSDNSYLIEELRANKIDSAQFRKLFGSKFYGELNLRNMMSQGQIFISGRKIKIGGRDAGESIYRFNFENSGKTCYCYGIHYLFVYNDKMIHITYVISSYDKERSKYLYDENKSLIYKSAINTLVLKNYEE